MKEETSSFCIYFSQVRYIKQINFTCIGQPMHVEELGLQENIIQLGKILIDRLFGYLTRSLGHLHPFHYKSSMIDYSPHFREGSTTFPDNRK